MCGGGMKGCVGVGVGVVVEQCVWASVGAWVCVFISLLL